MWVIFIVELLWDVVGMGGIVDCKVLVGGWLLFGVVGDWSGIGICLGDFVLSYLLCGLVKVNWLMMVSFLNGLVIV